MSSNDMSLKMLDWIEDHNNAIGRLTAKTALLDFIILHLVDKGALDDISEVSRDQLVRVIGLSEGLAAQTDDPDCVEPMTEMLRERLHLP